MRARTDDFAHKLYYRESDFTVVDRITEIAEARGVKNAQVALAWMLTKPGGVGADYRGEQGVSAGRCLGGAAVEADGR